MSEHELHEQEPLLQTESASKPSKLFTVCPYILGNELCERLAYYGISVNLPIYLTTIMQLSVGEASIQTSQFSATCYLTPLLGAWLADGYWGRYKTIMVFSSIYCAGMVLLASTALVPGLGPSDAAPPTPFQLGIFYVALYIVAIGTGGIKPNVSAFGADQFDDSDRKERQEKQSFFNWFYFSVNLGSIIAVTGIVWIQERSWGVGYAIPAVAMGMAVAIFVAGHSKYHHQKPMGSPIERVVDLSWHAAQHWVQLRWTRTRRAAQGSSSEVSDSPSATAEDAAAQNGAQEAALDLAGAKRGYSERQVEEVRLVLRLAPIFFLTIAYWTCFTQMVAVFSLQAQHMHRVVAIAGTEIEIPSASMTVFDTLSVLVLVPIYDGIVHPLLKRFHCELSMLQRIGWGFLVVAVTMAVAGTVEHRRRAAMAEGGNIGILAQIPQYTLVGASEVLAAIGQIEFFYDQAPDVMRSCCSALALLATALGAYLSAFLMSLVTKMTTWLDDLNNPETSHLDTYFFLLAAAMLVNTLAFAWVASGYEYKVVKHRAPLPLVGGQQRHAAEQHTQHISEDGVDHSQAIDIDQSRPGYGFQYQGTPSTGSDDAYSRSITVMPQTPVMPPNLR